FAVQFSRFKFVALLLGDFYYIKASSILCQQILKSFFEISFSFCNFLSGLCQTIDVPAAGFKIYSK
ncbi:hypothetical protein, partial [Planococcus beigongshangi]|uniref:hypothetical protein n=1 Tax=Planococcus beigongshangi TaxID=2782536 RepID=UPI001EEE923E